MLAARLDAQRWVAGARTTDRESILMGQSERPVVQVHTDHNPDPVRCFYEIPDAVARRLQPDGDKRTFVQCLADLLDGPDDNGGFWDEDRELRS
jgi:hypothetical protein